jgi:hypothetical protein
VRGAAPLTAPADVHEAGLELGALWLAVDRLVERAPRPADLVNHRLELFLARSLRAGGRPVPKDLVVPERRAQVGWLAVAPLLERARAAYDAPLLIVKGPELAARYPEPALRAFRDVDLVVADPEAAQRALLEAGFEEVGEPELYRDIHHLRPLSWPGIPLVIELHSRPKWIEPLAAPTASELIAGAVPSSLAPGFLTPAPAQHAVLVAVHSWAHEPLRRLRDLVDVAVLAAESDPAEAEAVARAWGVERLWATTTAVIERLVDERARRPLALRVWAQNVERARERTVFEHHLQRWLSDLWALPLSLALRRMPSTLAREATPGGGEGWRRKLSRSAMALRHARRRRSEHDDELGG